VHKTKIRDEIRALRRYLFDARAPNGAGRGEGGGATIVRERRVEGEMEERGETSASLEWWSVHMKTLAMLWNSKSTSTYRVVSASGARSAANAMCTHTPQHERRPVWTRMGADERGRGRRGSWAWTNRRGRRDRCNALGLTGEEPSPSRAWSEGGGWRVVDAAELVDACAALAACTERGDIF
jgi:hypothetical protein